MSLSEALLPEFDQEMANTPKTLERVPEDKLDWKPHPKSWSMLELATHIANLLTWTNQAIKEDSFDLNPPSGDGPRATPLETRQEILDRFDKNVSEAKDLIAGASDEHFLKPWTLLSGGKELFTLPRAAVLRSFVMNHGIHHRAQLGVYLRLNDVPVPAIYGPSADEGGM